MSEESFVDKSHTSCIAKAYDEYHGNGLYDGRYPDANINVIERILAHTDHLPDSAKVLDYGCGSGRYLLQLLKHTQVNAYGYDVSEVAIAMASRRLSNFRYRISLFFSQANLNKAVQHTGHMDVALLLFGVLSHIEGKEERRKILQWLYHSLIPDSGVLLISVPNRLRRFLWLQVKAWFNPDLAQQDGIYYERGESGNKVSLFYHLYSTRELIDELTEVGFVIQRSQPESVFPEQWVTRYRWLSRCDRFLSRVLPAWSGYGILVEARRSR